MDDRKFQAPIKPIIALDLLEKIDVRVGRVERVDEVKGSDKILATLMD
jgi:hypothetical protein